MMTHKRWLEDGLCSKRTTPKRLLVWTSSFLCCGLISCVPLATLPSCNNPSNENRIMTLNWKPDFEFVHVDIHSNGEFYFATTPLRKDYTKHNPPYRDNFITKVDRNGAKSYITVGPDEVSPNGKIEVYTDKPTLPAPTYYNSSKVALYQDKLFTQRLEKEDVKLIEMDLGILFNPVAVFDLPKSEDISGVTHNIQVVKPNELIFFGLCKVFVYHSWGAKWETVYSDPQRCLPRDPNSTKIEFEENATASANGAFYTIQITSDFPPNSEEEVSPFDVGELIKEGKIGQVNPSVARRFGYYDIVTGKEVKVMGRDKYMAGEVFRIKDGKRELLAGSKTRGFKDGKGSEARFHNPSYLVAAKDGTLYVSDTQNHAIRKIDPEGNVSTLVGNGQPGSANGEFKEGQLDTPRQLALGPCHTLYVFDKNGVRALQLPPGDSAERW